MNYRKNGRKCGIGIKIEGKRTKKKKRLRKVLGENEKKLQS